MIEKISAPIAVLLYFDPAKRKLIPFRIRWDGRLYNIKRIGMHHTYYEGRTLMHVFSVESDTLFFRLVFNTQNLHWRLEEIADELPN
jgi:AAA+ ATPase superfamily predicted ATPase